jgi:hypothetical protein
MISIDAVHADGNLNIALDHGHVTLTSVALEPSEDAVTLYLEDARLLSIDRMPTKATATRTVVITPPSSLGPADLAQYVGELTVAAKLKLEAAPSGDLTVDQRTSAATFWNGIAPLMTLLGISIVAPKKCPAKSQHRFKAGVAKVAFTVDFAGTQATVYWQKRNEMLVLAGAKMLADAPLNADGSVGFSARFANQLREEHADAFDPKTFTTTKDLVLKSVNEVGLFLYFGGTNSWLVLKDSDGKTIHDWTVVL